jgi:amino acid permease
MYEELENRSPRRFLCVLLVAFTSLGLLFAAFATVSYLAFGENVDSNVLNNLPKNHLSDVARIAVVGVVAAVYPIMVLPMVAPVRNLSLSWFSKTSDELVARRRRSLLVSFTTVLLVAISLFGSWQVHSLGIINVIDGALCVGVFTSLGPAMVGLFLLRRTSFLWRLSMWVLIVFGIAMSAFGFFFIQNQAGDLARHCFWHV